MQIKFGLSRSVTVGTDQYPSVSAVLGSADLRNILQFPENIGALVNGVDADAGQSLLETDLVELVTKANKKG